MSDKSKYIELAIGQKWILHSPISERTGKHSFIIEYIDENHYVKVLYNNGYRTTHGSLLYNIADLYEHPAEPVISTKAINRIAIL